MDVSSAEADIIQHKFNTFFRTKRKESKAKHS